jgi:transaldolase
MRAARDILAATPDRPISFEVFSDDFDDMYARALKIAAWGPNVYVKIPITDTKAESAVPLLRRFAPARVRTNVTAIFTQAQIQAASDTFADAAPWDISVFAGRIADSEEDPLPIMRRALEIMRPHPHQERSGPTPAKCTMWSGRTTSDAT